MGAISRYRNRVEFKEHYRRAWMRSRACRYRNRVEFKGLRKKCVISVKTGRYRNRVEFKVYIFRTR